MGGQRYARSALRSARSGPDGPCGAKIGPTTENQSTVYGKTNGEQAFSPADRARRGPVFPASVKLRNAYRSLSSARDPPNLHPGLPACTIKPFSSHSGIRHAEVLGWGRTGPRNSTGT